MRQPFTGSALFGLLLAACGGSVDTPPGSGGAGGAGGATSSASDGAGGATSSTSDGAGGATSSTSGGGGEAPVACGARSGGTCSAAEFCDFPDDSCGTFDTVGECSARPEVCPTDCPGVCGCDGQLYCNACAAQGAGVDVSKDTSCMKPVAVDYAAAYWPGGLDHIIVYKADPEANRCVMLFADSPAEAAREGFDVTLPTPWAVSRVERTDRAADCAPGTISPTGEAVNATGATGVLTWEIATAATLPCSLGLNVTVTFPDEPATVVLRATDVEVEGGCR
ncbi:hypothetical protein [Sorangium sp. So ce1182]|uniref:hypothetical protein n=1 Tax=Sorangium sp. So ce1182 TaxID=3133334 RepID=UPI003F63DC8B